MRPLPIAQSLLWTALAACPLGAVEVPHLLADINTTPSAQLPVSQAFGFIAVGGRLLFSTDGQDNGNDDEGILWQTDGTATGTRVLSSSLCPFPCRGISPLGTVLHGIALLKVSLGSFSTQKTQLWRSDGTATGTFPLTDLLDNEGAFDLTPLQIISSSSGDVFYFNGCRESDGCLLWRSDGSRAGTFPLPSTGDPRGFAFWAGRLYFLADVENGFGLWSTDGTVAGTAPLASVAELDEFSGTIVATPSHLFFTAGDGSEDLWVTDGTPDGARLLADLPPNPCFPGSGGCVQGDVFSLFAFGDAVFFVAHRPGHGTEIWHSDGTVSGTGPGVELPAGLDVDDRQRLGSRWLLRVVPRGTSSGGALWTADDDFSHAEPLTGCDGGACPDAVQLFSLATGGSLLFAGSDAPHGTELWITDGTGGGTHRLSDACPGACSAFSPDFSFLAGAVLGSAAELTYFRALPSATASPFESDDELWATDGTAEGTHRIAGHVSALGALNELAVFGVGEGGDDSEVWATDGTAAGTRRLATLQRTAPGSEPSIVPRNGGGVLLLAWDGHQEEFWRSDGTAAGTHPVPGAELGDNRALASTVLTPAAGLQFFTVVRQPANSNAFSDVELWRTDGTGPGTRVVASFGSHAELDFMTPWGSKVLFIVERPAGCSFWSSDGTAAGTRMIVPSVPGRRCPTAVAALDRSQFIFVARVEAHGGPVPQIFVSDGTPEGTRQISAIRGTRESFNQASPVVSGGFAFLQISGENDTESELWRSDGTATGTFRVFKDLGDAGDLFGYQGFLYFTADDPDGTWHLYQATVRGPGPPVALALSAPPDQSFASLQFTPAHGRLFFIGWDADAGNDLWVTDGTPAGTQRVGSPGSRSSAPDGLVAAGHRIFFSGDDGEHGRELWESDGTPGGTHMVFDLNPGGFSSSPANLAVSGNYLFFSADDGETGVEPWALRLEP